LLNEENLSSVSSSLSLFSFAVLIGAHDKAKLADFGLAFQLTASKEITNGYVGTERYMAPEFKRNYPHKTHGLNADVWSIGLVVSEIGQKLSKTDEIGPLVTFALQRNRDQRPSSKELMEWLSRNPLSADAAKHAEESLTSLV